MTVDVVTTGEAMGLILAADGRPLRQATRFERSVAGAESNVAIGLARLGHAVTFCGRVGADAVGQWVRDTLRAEGVDTRLDVDPQRPTGLLLRDCPTGRSASVEYYRAQSAASGLGPEHVDEGLVAEARAVFVSGITAMLSAGAGRYVERLLEVANGAGTAVFFDPNVRRKLAAPPEWRASFDRIVPAVDTLLISAAELTLLGLPNDPAAQLVGRVRTVVVTDGAAGAAVTSADGTVEVPAVPVPPIDPVGAGDAFTAGWLSAWLRGVGGKEALREAAAVAALVVGVPSDIDGLPRADERVRFSTQAADVDR
jgi:2-dehydro-3-deoxygluconokinase